MSGTFPSSPGFTAIDFESKYFNLSSESIAGRVQVRALSSQKWTFTVEFPPMDFSEYGGVNAFLIKQRGRLESFQIVLPVISDASGSATGSPTVNGSISIGATSFTVAGLTGTLKAGDFIKFASHSKVYMMTEDRAGAGTVTFEPSLVATVSNGSALTYNNVPFTVRLANDVQVFKYRVDSSVSYEIDMEEVI